MGHLLSIPNPCLSSHSCSPVLIQKSTARARLERREPGAGDIGVASRWRPGASSDVVGAWRLGAVGGRSSGSLIARAILLASWCSMLWFLNLIWLHCTVCSFMSAASSYATSCIFCVRWNASSGLLSRDVMCFLHGGLIRGTATDASNRWRGRAAPRRAQAAWVGSCPWAWLRAGQGEHTRQRARRNAQESDDGPMETMRIPQREISRFLPPKHASWLRFSDEKWFLPIFISFLINSSSTSAFLPTWQYL